MLVFSCYLYSIYIDLDAAWYKILQVYFLVMNYQACTQK